MGVTIIPKFVLLSYFTTDHFYYRLGPYLAPEHETDLRDT